MEQAKSNFTPVQVEKFQHTQSGNDFKIKQTKYSVHETTIDHDCNMCAFKEMGKRCPTQGGKKTPVCFAKNRPDKNSVYFVKNEKVVLVWEQI